ncbi:MAG: MFS transporter, partial [Nitrospiraceae bacterium]|nr:MFS transporter [Nitrospiraceae bacterium]
KKDELKKNSRKIFVIEGFSKFGSGILSNQYLNVLLYLLVNTNLFIVGLVTTLRYVVSLFGSFYTEKRLQYLSPSKIKLSLLGFLIAITATLLGYSLVIKNVVLFIVFFVLIGYFLNRFNKTYISISSQLVKKEKRNYLFRRLAFFMISFSILGLFIGAFVLDRISTKEFVSSSHYLPVIFIFLIYSTVYYIVSFIILSFKGLRGVQINERKSLLSELKSSFEDIKIFFRDRLIALLFVAGFLMLFITTIGNSFYGIFIFNQMNAFGNLKFLRIAIIFSVTIIASLIGPYIVRINSHGSGKMVMLVFGTFLSAFLPFFLSIYPLVPLTSPFAPYLNLSVIAFAALVNFIGVSIVGTAFGMVVVDLVPTDHRKKFFNSNQVALIIPSLIFMPIASYIAQVFGLKVLFMTLALMTVFLVTPLYFLIIVISERKKKQRIRNLI